MLGRPTGARAYSRQVGSFVLDVLTGVPPWVVLVTTFLLPFVECSLFVGFVFPGETALLLAGVLASGAVVGQSRPSLLALCVLATLGAVLGDSLGYAVGRRYGPALQRSRAGRVVGEARWAAATAYLRRRGGPAVFLGRFTALLRALVPSAAGMSHLPFRTFLLWNAVGGLVWANGAVLAGYAAGESYETVEGYLGRGALVMTGLVLLVALGVHLWRRRSHAAAGPPTTGDAPGVAAQRGPEPDSATSVPSGR